MLSFQRLDVYQRAIEFVALASEIVEELKAVNVRCVQVHVDVAVNDYDYDYVNDDAETQG